MIVGTDMPFTSDSITAWGLGGGFPYAGVAFQNYTSSNSSLGIFSFRANDDGSFVLWETQIINGAFLTILPTSTGLFGVGISPTATLHLRAGTATASTGPLKFTAGTNTTITEPGLMEYDGNYWYGTLGSSARKTFAFRELTVRTTSVSASVASSDDVILADEGALMADLILTLPSVVTQGKKYVVKRVSNGTHNIVITPQIGDKIDGASTYTLTVLNQSITIVADGGTNWDIIAIDDNFVKLQSSTPGTAQTGNLNLSGTGIFGTLKPTNPLGITYGGTGATSVGNLLVGTNLSVSGGTGVIIGGSNATISLGNAVVTSVSNDTNITGSISVGTLTFAWASTLAVGRGGTGTGTAFTAGSVLFAGTSGVYNQDNSKLFWDDTNFLLGIGTASPTAFIHTSASTTSYASLRIPTGTAPTSPNEGDIWNDSTQKSLKGRIDGVTTGIMNVLYTSNTSNTVTSTNPAMGTALTMMPSGVGSLTLPANFWTPGKTVKVYLTGVYTTAASGQGGGQATVNLGATAIVQSSTDTVTANISNQFWYMDFTITCVSTGVSGTFWTQGGWDRAISTSTSSTTITRRPMSNTALITVDTTAQKLLDVTWLWTGNTTGNNIVVTNAYAYCMN